MKISYNWLQNYFTEELPKPEKISEGIIFHSFEVESLEMIGTGASIDWIFDIKVLPDRAHDCLSHWGIAKEISVIFNIKIKEKEYKTFETKPTKLNIEIKDDKCLRYMGRVIRNIKVEESPKWLKERLKSIGQKSINNIVDAANFVMFDLGQPIHCFDIDKMKSEKIIIRNATNDEKIKTLDKKEINLDDSILVIADNRDLLAIAGIKGGTKAEVDFNTKNIIIEVANFNAITTRKISKKIGIFTDAVRRYENEISSELCEKTMNAITDLIWELTGAGAEKIIDIYPQKAEQREVSVSVDYINKRLGTYFLKEEIENVWEKLNFKFSENKNEFKIKIPYLRVDITGPHDLTEEVGRILGYDKIEEKLPELNLTPKVNETFFKILFARNKLLNKGYSEVMTYTFRGKGEVEVLASASDKKFLRTNLSDGLKESMNLNNINFFLFGINDTKIFEIGTVWCPDEKINIAYFSDEKDPKPKEMTLDEFCKDINISDSYNELLSTFNFQLSTKRFAPWSVFPFIVRDVAVWVPEGEDPEKLKKILKENGTELLVREPYIFDSFTKNGKTSYAFRLVFQSYEKTLTDDEINIVMDKINHKIKENSNWELR